MRLSGPSVKAWVDKLGLPRTSSAKDETWTTSDTTGDAYRIITFGSKQPAAGGSAFGEARLTRLSKGRGERQAIVT